MPLSRYETVANLQPGGTCEVSGAQAIFSHETGEFQLNSFELVNGGVPNGHPNRNGMLTNMDGRPATTIDQATLDEIVRRILSVASPEKIILFGSAATGEMNADSDIDLLIVEADPGNQRKESVRIHSSLRGLGHSFDVIVIGNEWFEASKNVIGGIAYPANKYGKVIYDAA